MPNESSSRPIVAPAALERARNALETESATVIPANRALSRPQARERPSHRLLGARPFPQTQQHSCGRARSGTRAGHPVRRLFRFRIFGARPSPSPRGRIDQAGAQAPSGAVRALRDNSRTRGGSKARAPTPKARYPRGLRGPPRGSRNFGGAPRFIAPRAVRMWVRRNWSAPTFPPPGRLALSGLSRELIGTTPSFVLRLYCDVINRSQIGGAARNFLATCIYIMQIPRYPRLALL